jgi:hypothetical protein
MFDPVPIHTEVTIADARSRSNMNHALLNIQKKLNVIDEAKNTAFYFGTQVPPRFFNDACARERL